ncbi:hypothetical protein FOBRF1_005121 [Fusarium oxysporum]
MEMVTLADGSRLQRDSSPRLASPGLSGHPTSNQSIVSGCPENLPMTRMIGLVIRDFSADRYMVDGRKMMMLLCYEKYSAITNYRVDHACATAVRVFLRLRRHLPLCIRLLGSTWFIDLVLVQGTETLKRIFERCEIGWRQPSALDMLLRKSLNNSTALFLLFIA